MADRLLLRLAADGSLSWLRQGDARALSGSNAGAPPAAAIAAAASIVVLVPAEDVLITQAQVAARSRAQLLQAAPFAVEDQLLDAVEDLHFAIGAQQGDHVGVGVVARARMREWLAALAALGVRPDVLIPDSLALPLRHELATVLVEDRRALVRLAPWSAFGCASVALDGWLAHISADTPIAPLDVHDFGTAPALELAAPVAHYAERQRDALAWLADGVRAPALNLLDGEFAVRHRQARGVRLWRTAAILAAAVIVLAFVRLGVEVVGLSRTSARIDTLEQDTVRRAFPDIDAAQLGRISPEQLMRARLDRLRGGAEASGLLRVLSDIAPVLGSTTRIQTLALEYRNGSLELALRAPDVAALDQVRQRFAAIGGHAVELATVNPAPDGVDGRIRIGASP